MPVVMQNPVIDLEYVNNNNNFVVSKQNFNISLFCYHELIIPDLFLELSLNRYESELPNLNI